MQYYCMTGPVALPLLIRECLNIFPWSFKKPLITPWLKNIGKTDGVVRRTRITTFLDKPH